MRKLLSRHQANLLACATIVFLSACAAGSHSIQPESIALDPASLSPGRDIAGAASQDHAPIVTEVTGWWAAWSDPQLDRLLASDTLRAPSIEKAAARLRRASASMEEVGADRAPHINASGEATGERFPDHATYPTPYAGSWGSGGSVAVNMSYALDFWGKRREAQAAAFARADVANAEAKEAVLLLRIALVDAYVRLDASYRLRDLAIAGLARRQAIIDLLATRERAGLATSIETRQAQEAITFTQDDIARLDGEIALRRHQIAALLGRDSAFADELARPSLQAIEDPRPSSAIPANLLGARPDVTAARISVEAAAHDIGVARAAFYPDVNLVAFAGVQSLGLNYLLRAESIAAGAGPTVTLPIFDGGRLRANLRGKAAAYDAAVAEYNDTLTRALQEVADGIASVSAGRKRQSEARAAVTHWLRILDLQRLREHQGLSGATERLSGETALLLAERRAVEADSRLAVAQVTLIQALGGAWSPSSSHFSGQSK